MIFNLYYTKILRNSLIRGLQYIGRATCARLELELCAPSDARDMLCTWLTPAAGALSVRNDPVLP